MGAGQRSLSWMSKEEEFESGSEGCDKGQITLMLGKAALSTETGKAPSALCRVEGH